MFKAVMELNASQTKLDQQIKKVKADNSIPENDKWLVISEMSEKSIGVYHG